MDGTANVKSKTTKFQGTGESSWLSVRKRFLSMTAEAQTTLTAEGDKLELWC